MHQVLYGFAPWIIFWTCSGAGHTVLGILAGFTASAGLVAWRWLTRRNVKTLEVTTLAYLLFHVIVTLFLGRAWLITHGPFLNGLVLSCMAFGTLLARNPFTYQYAREQWDQAYWDDPDFFRINAIITACWGVIFSLNALWGLLATFHPSHRTWLALMLPYTGIAAGIVFSSCFPMFEVRRGVRQMLREQNPYTWPPPRFHRRPPRSANEHDVIVVGAGIGGLSASALLAKRGLRVAIFEQHSLAGGYCTSWERHIRNAASDDPGGGEGWRYVFDAGVHDVSGLGERGAVRSLLRLLDIEDRIQWQRTTHEYFMGDTHLRVPSDPAALVRELAERFPAEAENIDRFFDEMRRVYDELFADIEKTGGAPHPPETVEQVLDYPRTHPYAYKWQGQSFATMLDTCIENPALKGLLSVLSGYLTDAPDTLTVGEMAPLFGYHFDGGHYPRGSSQALPDALAEVIRQHGGRLFLKSAVKKIHVENGKAAGVELADGTRHQAQAVLSNADFRHTFLELVGREHLPPAFIRRIDALTPSTSAYLVFLGVDFVPRRASVVMLDEIAIMIPSLDDPALAPPGHAAITLIKFVPSSDFDLWDRRAPGYTALKQRTGDEMIATAERVMPALRDHITYRQDATPATCARYTGATRGAIYGPASGQPRLHTKTPIQHLYLAGSAVMGGGIEAVTIAGIHAAREIGAGWCSTSPTS